jgi:ParB-like chromosome segregation protein Spo0J
MTGHVASAFQSDLLVLPIASLMPLKEVSEAIKDSAKYRAIAASIDEVGLVEPLVVFRKPDRRGRYVLLDGSLRREILSDRGILDAECLQATDDEAFSYNKTVNRLAIVQEHFLILRAIERGVSEKKIARALNVNVDLIKSRRRMLKGICPQAVHLLRDKSVNPVTFDALRKMKSSRQIEACRLMVAGSNYSSIYSKALLAATKDEDRVKPAKPLCPRVVTLADLALLERELKQVQQSLREIDASYGRDMLDLTISARYISRLLESQAISSYLEDNHPEIVREFRAVVSEVLPQASLGKPNGRPKGDARQVASPSHPR